MRDRLQRQRWLLPALCALALSGCLLPAQRVPVPDRPLPPADPSAQDAGPTGAIDRASLEALPDPIARAEPRSPGGNMSPYTVLGQTYEVMATADDYVAEGLASWYGTKFHGRATSNGEVFDMYTLTAAHKSLPIPSYVRVTNLNNGRATILRVNDRGPFHDDRLIDLSYAAAVKLGFDLQGTAPVRIEMVAAPTGVAQVRRPRAAPAVAAAAAPAGPARADRPCADAPIYLQAGAFRSREAAERMERVLRGVLGDGAAIALAEGDDNILRVRIGPLRDIEEANRLQSRLAEAEQARGVIVRG